MSPTFRRPAAAGFTALGLLLGASAAQAAPQAPPQFDSVRRAILQTLEEAKVPSIAVAIVKDGKIVWEDAFGWADVERRIPATAHTAYSLASMTKPITATAVMNLAEAGRLDLDAPIERFLGGVKLPGAPAQTREVTARRIMSHSAGLPQYGHFYLDGAEPAGSKVTISRFAMPVFPPNTRFEYSNIGMKVLDAAVEQVSGQTFGQYLRREVFGPLGMKDSAVGLPAGRTAAVRYDPERKPMGFYLTDHPGSGDVWSSAHDMARFLAFHMGTPLPGQAQVLEPATRLAMQRPASAAPMPTPPDAPRRDIGANWVLSTINGHPQVWHSGGQPGVSSFMTFYPDQKLAFVLLANSSAPLGRVGQAIREAIAPEVTPPPEAASRPAAQPIPFRGAWRGTATSYAGPQPLELTFHADGRITVRLADQAATQLGQASFEDGALSGRFEGRSNIPEAQRAAHGLALKVVPVGGELVGQLVAQGMNADTVFMLPSRVRLLPAPEAR